MKKKELRIDWVDVCKAMGILLVTMGHLETPNSFDIWIHAFHMPLFFILSGFCFNEIKHNNFFKFLYSRFKTLVIPYVIFSILLYYFWVLVLHLLANGTANSNTEIFKCMLNPSFLTTCYGAVNWFLPSLFFIEIVFLVIGKIVEYNKKKIFIIMIIISIFAFFYPKIIGAKIPLAIDTSIMGLSFYGFGWLMKNINFNKVMAYFKKNAVWSIIIMILSFVFLMPLVFENNMTNMRTLTYGNYSLYMINSFGYSLLFILIAQLLKIYLSKSKLFDIIKLIGKHTLIIFLFNPIIDRLYLLIVGDFSITNSYLLLLNNMVVSIIVLLICTVISIIINRFFPFLIGKRKEKESL